MCWVLGKNISNFVPPTWKLDNPYNHNVEAKGARWVENRKSGSYISKSRLKTGFDKEIYWLCKYSFLLGFVMCNFGLQMYFLGQSRLNISNQLNTPDYIVVSIYSIIRIYNIDFIDKIIYKFKLIQRLVFTSSPDARIDGEPPAL